MKPLRLLYAEDNPTDADLTLAHFAETDPDITVEILDSGEPCERRLSENAFDLLLLDNHLPDIDGVEVLKRIRSAGHRLPIVMLTGSGDQDSVSRAISAGADDFVTKGGNYLTHLPMLLREILTRVHSRNASDEGGERRSRQVLYVESNQQDAEGTLSTLEREVSHCRLKVVGTFQHALELLAESHRYDLLLIDVKTDDLNPVDFVQTIRTRGLGIPFILVSKDGDERDALTLLRLGASDFLVKRDNYLARLPHAIERALQRAQIDKTNERLRSDLKSLNASLEARVAKRTGQLEEETRERLRAQDALIRASARYSSTLENMIEGCQIIDSNWEYLFVNDSAAQHGRKSRRELVGRRMMDVYPGIETSDLFRHLQRCMADRIPARVENEFAYEDGRTCWFEVRIEPIPEGLFLLTIDISDRKRFEQDILDAKDDLAVTLQSISDGVIATDSARLVTRINQTAQRLTGWSEAEAQGRPLDEIFRITDAAGAVAGGSVHDAAARETMPGPENHATLLSRDGRKFKIAHAEAPIRGLDGLARGLVLTFKDVTEERRVQEALKARELQLTRITDALPGPVSQVSADGTYLFVNATFAQWVGRKPAELLGRRLADILDPAQLKGAQPMLNRVAGGEVVTYETEYSIRAGSRRHAVITLIPDTDSLGKRSGFLAVGTDITSRKAAEDRVRRSEALFRIAGKTARLGGWALERSDQSLTWTDGVFDIHDLKAGTAAPSGDQALAYYALESQPRVRTAVTDCLDRGRAFDLQVELVTAADRRVWVRVTGEAERDDYGNIIRVHGAIQDIDGAKRNEIRVNDQLQELLRWQGAMVNRELRTAELKAEVNSLRAQLNLPAQYKDLSESR